METIYKVVSYKYTKERNNRRKDRAIYTKNVWTEESMFTSKAKAIDKARYYSEGLDRIAWSYIRFDLGVIDFYYDKSISVMIYQENEGALILDEVHNYKETYLGDVISYDDRDKFFETL